MSEEIQQEISEIVRVDENTIFLFFLFSSLSFWLEGRVEKRKVTLRGKDEEKWDEALRMLYVERGYPSH